MEITTSEEINIRLLVLFHTLQPIAAAVTEPSRSRIIVVVVASFVEEE